MNTLPAWRVIWSGQAARIEREALGLSPIELAEILGCSAAVIRAYERDSVVPGFDAAAEIATVLEVPLDQLTRRVSRKEPYIRTSFGRKRGART